MTDLLQWSEVWTCNAGAMRLYLDVCKSQGADGTNSVVKGSGSGCVSHTCDVYGISENKRRLDCALWD